MAVEIFENQAKEIEYYSKKGRTKLIKVDKNGTYIFADCTCNRCGGDGIIPYYNYIDGGVCFECGGSGVSEQGATEIKIYTDEYGAKLKAQREAREEKKRQEMLAGSENRRKAWMEKEGFNEDGKTWLFLGNTYEIKEQLKEIGAKFNPILGWHINHEVEGYKTLVCDVIELTEMDYKGDIDYRRSYTPEGGDPEYDSYCFRARVDEMKKEALTNLCRQDGEVVSEYIGNVGDRLDFEAELINCFTFEVPGYLGWETEMMHIYKFKTAEGNIVVWKTTSYLNPYFNDNQTHFIFKGTVKEHSEYKGEKQTVINRPKFM